MNITTLIFMIFLMAGLLIYYLIPSRFQDLLSDTQPFSMAVPAGAVLRFPLGG